MTAPNADSVREVIRSGGLHVQHYEGVRPTRRTFRGVAEMSDGSRIKCPHDLHRTPEAAARCAVKSAQSAGAGANDG